MAPPLGSAELRLAAAEGSVWVSCPMCGYEFDREDTLCGHGCPLGSLCNLVRCSNCGYEFPDAPRRRSWLRRLLSREAKPSRLPPDVRSVSALEPGETASVVCMGERKGSRYGTLSAFGLVAGAEVMLIQRRPSCVVKIGETELALDPEIAEELLVRPLG
ncbi:MAG: ferrous iron transport protein A [Gemmatimonadota bacterium]|nr:MAG: ferrous iron transport protein A [Gemmatimonadota bacterium]